MTEKTFLGYERPNGYAGARNYVLIMPINRSLNFIASNVAKMTRGTRHFEIPAETGRPAPVGKRMQDIRSDVHGRIQLSLLLHQMLQGKIRHVAERICGNEAKSIALSNSSKKLIKTDKKSR